MTTESVVVLFTDMVGSTELSTSMAPDAADELRRSHFSILRQAIAEGGGTEVKNLGDGLMVVFTSASAGLAVAVAMQQGIERDNRRRERLVGLRVGMSGGEVTREDGDYFGDPVVEAARLCATCSSGQILAADIVPLMAGRRNRYECRPLGELRLKGLPDSVDAVEVGWEPLDTVADPTAIPLPGRLTVRPTLALVGRDRELGTLADAVKRVAGGEGREVVLVSGEAGLGKTTLVAEASRAAHALGAVVLFGHCEEDLARPYQLFSEALGHYVTHAPEEQLLAHVEAYGAELAALVPSLSRRLPGLPPSRATDADTERYLLFAAVVGLLDQMSQHQPVVVVLDDLQWADKASLLLLRHLVGAARELRLVVVGTYRDNELARSEALLDTLAALRRAEGVTRVELAGLDDSGVLALMEASAGYALDQAATDLAQAVYRETDGNPFFVTEVLWHLSETGAIYQDAGGRWMAQGSLEKLALPDSIREVIGARLSRLGSDAGRVLSMAAVIGRDFDLDLLARATVTPEDDLLDILDAAVEAALVRELTDAPGRYNFAHALIQTTLYEGMGRTRRALAHRQVAEALEDLCGDRPGPRVGELAHHWFSAIQPVSAHKAIRYAREAGDAALAGLAPDDALRYYAQALDLYREAATRAAAGARGRPGDGDDEVLDPVVGLDLAIGLGTAQRQTGDPGFRDTLLDAARQAAELDDTPRLVAAALANNRGWFSAVGVTDHEKIEILEIALARLPADAPDRALVLAALCSEVAYGSPLDRRQALASEAVSIAREHGDDTVMVRVVNHVLLPLMVPSLLDQLLEWTADAMVRAERIGDPALTFFTTYWRAFVVHRAGDIDEVDRCYERMGSLAGQLDQSMLWWMLNFDLATRALMAGDPDRADELSATALQFGTDSGQPDSLLFYGAQMMVASLERGTLGDLIPVIEEMATGLTDVALGSALALAKAEADQWEDVRRLLDEFAAVGFDAPLDAAWLTELCGYAEATIALGDATFAGPLFDALQPFSSQWSHTGTITEGPVSYYLGGLATVLGRFEEAEAHLAAAAEACARAGAKFFAARTDLRWGLSLIARVGSGGPGGPGGPGDQSRARELLERARAIAAANGYATVARRAGDALSGAL